MTDRDNFSDKKLSLLPNSFWKSHHFIMRWHFPLDVLCVKEHEHWYSGISSEFIMHNTRVIGLQIASKETWKRSPYSASLVWLAMWNVHGRTQRKKCSVSHWKFLKKGGFSASLPLIVQALDIPIMIRWVDQWNVKTSWTQYMYIYECSQNSCQAMQVSVEIGLYSRLYCFNNKRFGNCTPSPNIKDCHVAYRHYMKINSMQW